MDKLQVSLYNKLMIWVDLPSTRISKTFFSASWGASCPTKSDIA